MDLWFASRAKPRQRGKMHEDPRGSPEKLCAEPREGASLVYAERWAFATRYWASKRGGAASRFPTTHHIKTETNSAAAVVHNCGILCKWDLLPVSQRFDSRCRYQ